MTEKTLLGGLAASLLLVLTAAPASAFPVIAPEAGASPLILVQQPPGLPPRSNGEWERRDDDRRGRMDRRDRDDDRRGRRGRDWDDDRRGRDRRDWDRRDWDRRGREVCVTRTERYYDRFGRLVVAPRTVCRER